MPLYSLNASCELFYAKLLIARLRKPIRAIRFSDKYDLRFQDRSFDVELLLQAELLFKLELLKEVELLLEDEVVFDLELLLEVELLLKVELLFDLELLLGVELLPEVKFSLEFELIFHARIIVRTLVTIRTWVFIRSRVTIRNRITIRSRAIIRIPIVGANRNTVRSPINIRFRNTNRYWDNWWTASDSRGKRTLGGNDSRVEKTNVGAEINSCTCVFISLFLDSWS